MSKNARQKPPVTPVKPSKRRGSDSSSSLESLTDLSDSDGYSAVGGISDSDEDEEDVIAAEESHILDDDDDEQAIPSNHGSPWPSTEEAAEEGDDEEEEYEDDDEDDEDEEEATSQTEWEGFMSEGNDATDASPTQEVTERRVRFTGVPDSDGDTTETDDDRHDSIFPDIFVAQNSLDPMFRREIEDEQDNSSDSGSFWDLHGSLGDDMYMTNLEDMPVIFESDSTPAATPGTLQEPSTTMSTPVASPQKDDDDDMSDGYKTDDEDGGDTTDEDEEPAMQPAPQQTLRETPSRSSDTDVLSLMRRHRGKPRVGKFNLDSDGTKPIAVVNPKTGKLMIFTPQKLSRLDLSPEAFNFNFPEFLFDHDLGQSSSILSNSGNLMMGAMVSSNTFGDFMNGTQAVGPAEAFMPPASALEDISEEEEYDEYEEDHDEQRLTIDDFLDMGDLAADQDNVFDEGDQYWTTPHRHETPGDDVNSLLDHSHLLNNSHLAGAFRRDQQTHALLRTGQATRDSLAFSGPLHNGTLRGIKDGRIASTNIPISPMRKHRRTISDAASSPLANASQKRKLSSEQHFGHKRQRSIPDVEVLTLQ